MNYYFDLETSGLNPECDKIISIQFQALDFRGEPRGSLVILKEWESNEEEIVKRFSKLLRKWDFIPIGMNLNFDFNFLLNKFRKYNINTDFSLGNFPHLDIKPILVMMNNGNFKGAKLSNFTEKGQNGVAIPFYYNNREYDKIEDYIRKEAEEFIKFYRNIKTNLASLRGDIHGCS